MSPSHSRSGAQKTGSIVRKTWVPIVALGLAFTVTACSPVQTVDDSPQGEDVTSAPIGDQTIVEGGDLVMALSAEPDRLDPTTSSSLYTRYVMQTMCERIASPAPSTPIVQNTCSIAWINSIIVDSACGASGDDRPR